MRLALVQLEGAPLPGSWALGERFLSISGVVAGASEFHHTDLRDRHGQACSLPGETMPLSTPGRAVGLG